MEQFNSPRVYELSDKFKKASATEILRNNWNKCIDKRFLGKCDVYNVKGDIAFIATANAQIKQNIVFSEKKILMQKLMKSVKILLFILLREETYK